jgi:hypothetical protein
MNGIALKMAQDMLTKIDKEIADKTGDLGEKRNILANEIKKLTRGTGTDADPDSVPEQNIVDAIKHLTSGDHSASVSSPEIAEYLKVDVRRIARKLARMGSEKEKIAGNKTLGYSLAK